MAIDYISTAPWNDPLNPWPKFNQFKLSAADIESGALLTYSLSTFDPTTPYVVYAADVAGNYMIYEDIGGIKRWSVFANGLYWYDLTTDTRALPAGWIQGNTDWNNVDGYEKETLSIIPITSSLNGWELRRRRLLEIP